MSELIDGEWNGDPAKVRKIWATVAEAPQFAAYWAQEFVGSERPAVEVVYQGRVFYLDDEGGKGWEKVTRGGGLPRIGHKNLEVSDVRPRD